MIRWHPSTVQSETARNAHNVQTNHNIDLNASTEMLVAIDSDRLAVWCDPCEIHFHGCFRTMDDHAKAEFLD